MKQGYSDMLYRVEVSLRSCVLMQVFKVARETGPSVIYLDEAEKVSVRLHLHYTGSFMAPTSCKIWAGKLSCGC